MRKKGGFIRVFLSFTLIYMALTSVFFWIVKDDWRQTAAGTDPVNRDALLPESVSDSRIIQKFNVAADRLQFVTVSANLLPNATDRNKITITVSADGERFFSREFKYEDVDPNGSLKIPMDDILWLEKGMPVQLSLQAEGGLSFWYGRTRTAGKFQIEAETAGLWFNDEPVEGELVLSQQGIINLPYMRFFLPAAAALFLLLSLAIAYCYYCWVSQKENAINKGIRLIGQYRYLLKTLVVRDFKIKYKASMLGVLWSFLNPLLMTFVYMFVFSTLFRSSIENFVVYLMSGIILFNYFSEATNLGMQSIVGNAGLITKVYMPKYILPISKVLSSAINMAISLIPLMIMMAITGVRFSKSLILIPLVLFFLILFSVGVSLILASAMVYFRDVQFLWGIFLTILNFLSPIFYPESIIPARYITVYHMNPIYQYLFFMRTVTIGGISPTPATYIYCTLASFVTLGIGLFIFRRAQSQFVLHL